MGPLKKLGYTASMIGLGLGLYGTKDLNAQKYTAREFIVDEYADRHLARDTSLNLEAKKDSAEALISKQFEQFNGQGIIEYFDTPLGDLFSVSNSEDQRNRDFVLIYNICGKAGLFDVCIAMEKYLARELKRNGIKGDPLDYLSNYGDVIEIDDEAYDALKRPRRNMIKSKLREYKNMRDAFIEKRDHAKAAKRMKIDSIKNVKWVRKKTEKLASSNYIVDMSEISAPDEEEIDIYREIREIAGRMARRDYRKREKQDKRSAKQAERKRKNYVKNAKRGRKRFETELPEYVDECSLIKSVPEKYGGGIVVEIDHSFIPKYRPYMSSYDGKMKSPKIMIPYSHDYAVGLARDAVSKCAGSGSGKMKSVPYNVKNLKGSGKFKIHFDDNKYIDKISGMFPETSGIHPRNEKFVVRKKLGRRKRVR